MPPPACSRPVFVAFAVKVEPLAAVAPDVERKIRPAIRSTDAGTATARARACRIWSLLRVGEVEPASVETGRIARMFLAEIRPSVRGRPPVAQHGRAFLGTASNVAAGPAQIVNDPLTHFRTV